MAAADPEEALTHTGAASDAPTVDGTRSGAASDAPPVGVGLAPAGGGEGEVQTDLGQVEYLAVGHISIDIFEKRYVLGGTVSFAALTARQLGQQVGVLTSADFEPLIMDTLIGR